MTLEEAQAQMVTVNSAISSMLAGNRLTRLEVGSGALRRTFQYTDLTLESLTAYRDYLQGVINALTPELSAPSFRKYTTIPMIVKKDRYNVQ